MSLTSMTGFARAAGALGPWRWTVEIKCVNAKGLDLQAAACRRASTASRARRGRGSARRWRAAPVSRRFRPRAKSAATQARLDLSALERDHLRPRASAAAKAGLAPPTMDGVLAVRGVVEVVEAVDDEASFAAVCAGALESLDAAIVALVASRRAEGAALQAILSERLDAIARLTQAADDNPARRPEAVRARLAAAVAALLESCARLRRESAAPGGHPARRQGRHPRGARPAEDPCRGGAARCSPRADRSAGGSIFSPRSLAARPTRYAPRPTTSR
jgi:uncharacterized protein YicC (UPF0701 family)